MCLDYNHVVLGKFNIFVQFSLFLYQKGINSCHNRANLNG